MKERPSFIEKNHTDHVTGRVTCTLDSRYGQERTGLPKIVAMQMIRVDDLIASANIKPGDQFEVLQIIGDPLERHVSRWQSLQGRRFRSVHDGKLMVYDPDTKNGCASISYDLREIRGVRPVARPEDPAPEAPQEDYQPRHGAPHPMYINPYKKMMRYDFGVGGRG